MALSYGVRHEMQSDIGVRLNLAPRVGFSWLLDDAGRNAIKAGTGVFYGPVTPDIIFDTKKADGIKRQQFTIERPGFFTTGQVPQVSSPVQSTVYTKADDLRAPSSFVTTLSYERRLPADLFAVAQYLFSKGTDLLRLRNVTAPLSGASAASPLSPVLQFESTGRSLQHQLMVGLRQNTADISLYANYTYGAKHSDTDGPYSLPASSYDLAAEYGWAADDQRHQFVAGATVEVADDLQITPSISIASGRPFNITTGLDNNHDTVFTDRPALAQPGDPGAIETAFGLLNPNPLRGAAIVPRNAGREPMQMNIDVSVTKAIAKRMTMTFDAQNVLNNARLFGTTGVLVSPVFGTPNQALNGRRFWLTVRYGF